MSCPIPRTTLRGNQRGRRFTCILAVAAFVLCIGASARAADPRIDQLTPREVSRGEVLTIVGEHFGSEQRSRVVYSPRIDGHRRPGKTPLRVVSWTDTTIRVQVPENLQQADSYAVWVDVPHTNFMSFTLKTPPPPAEAAGESRRPQLDRVHPNIGRPGSEVDLYGDFTKPPEASPRVILVNRHGVPVERVLETSIWTDRRIRIAIPQANTGDGYQAFGDEYQVFVRWINMLAPDRQGRMHPRESNRLQLVVRTTNELWWERGNPRIVAIEPPGDVVAGSVIDILGEDFGAQDRKKIAITPYRYHPFNEVSSSAPTLEIISWSDVRIRARLPASLASREHFLFIYWSTDYEDRSNQVSLMVQARGVGAGAGILPAGEPGEQRRPRRESPSEDEERRQPPPPAVSADSGRAGRRDPTAVPFVTGSGMMIERVSIQRQAGSRILVLGGRRFGSVQGQKLVSLNRSGARHVAQVIAWSDSEVRVRVPANLAAGEYRVLIYYDGSQSSSSNSLPITLSDAGPPVVRRPPPPARRAGRT